MRWIKISTALLEWGWHDEPEILSFWVHALLMASPEDKKYKETPIKRGQFFATLGQMSQRTGLSVQQVRTCLKKLQKTGEISVDATNKYSIITICNYDTYQNRNYDSNNQATNEQQTDNTPITNEQQSSNIPSTPLLRIIDNKNINNNKQQQEGEPKFFHSVEECKAFLLSKGRNCTEQGFKKFYQINQEGTKSTKPYWYSDGVIDSFDNFISKDSNKRYRLNDGKGTSPPKSSAAAPQVPLWQSSPHEYWAIKIGKLSKSDSTLGNVLSKIELVGTEGNVFYYRPKVGLTKFEIDTFNSAMPSINAEFRGVKLQYKHQKS